MQHTIANTRMANLLLMIAALWIVATAGLTAKGSVADFYQGNVVTILVGYGTGGGNDLYARLLARHIGRHIPGNPRVIVQNMPGAGSLVAANYLYAAAPKNGSVFGTFARELPLAQLVGVPGVQFDTSRFHWIGSLNEEVIVGIYRADSGIKQFEDIFNRPLVVGSSGPGSTTYIYPALLNGMLGTKFQIVAGYSGIREIGLAMERGEVQGLFLAWSGVKSTWPDWLEKGFIRSLVQLGIRKHPDLAEVPLILEYTRDDDTLLALRTFFISLRAGRPFAAPPGVPPERIAALRKAFLDTVRDPLFLAEASQAKLEINHPATGEEIQQLVTETLSAPARVIELIKQYAPRLGE